MFRFRFFFFKRQPNANDRKFPRKNTQNLVALENPQKKILTLVDISEGGLQLSSPERLSKNQIVELTVNLAQIEKQIQVLGRVVWNRCRSGAGGKFYQMGISFLELSQEARDVIRSFVQTSFKTA